MTSTTLTQLPPSARDNNTLTLTVIGHSTVLINIHGKRILTDPVLFSKIGYHIGKIKIGIKRLRPATLTVDDIPHVDFILLSHAHMDHRDTQSLQALTKKFPDQIHIICPKNTKKYLHRVHHIKQVTELDREEETTIDGIYFRAGETRHRGARRPRERNKHHKGHPKSPGYNSYLINHNKTDVVFGGDTAYTDTYTKLGNDIEVAIMPIGAYDPWTRHHCTPEEAVHMAEHMGAKWFVPIHFETFRLDKASLKDPITRLEKTLTAHPRMKLAIENIGGVFVL